ncbi:unnamed protein product [Ectocarpus sp. CCAP 1310/34]|nr:unnamed protein product [Ectocarpus sp. CCAP 1310/34]
MTPRRQQQQQQRQATAEGGTTARNPSAPSRSRLQGSRAACSMLTAAAVAAVTAPLSAEAWVSHAAARSSRQAQPLGWTSRGRSGYNRCQVQRQRGSGGGDRESSQLSGRGVSGRRRRVVSCRSQAVDEASSTEYKPMEEGDEVLIDFDESEFDESEDFFAVEGDDEDEEEDESTRGPVQVIGVEEAMDRVRELKKLGPPVPVKGERARSKRRFPVVAVIGRPNVGKSTVVNRLAKRFKDGSIVFDESGVTRDRTYKRAWYCGKDFDVVDTGGLVFDDKGGDVFAKEIRQQALIALEEATAVIMVVDGMAGCNVLDQEIARFLRQQKVPVILAVNKCESQKYGEIQTAEFWCLGLGEPWPISGLHGDGIYDMMDNVAEHLYEVDESAEEEDNINVAIVGRPNVGKSSLLNRLFGETRSIVSDVPGTTRDSIDAMFERGGRTYRLVDTAGIRRKGKVDYGNEFFMVNRAFKAIRRADVVLLMVDVEAGITDQDRVLADRIQSDGRACVVVCNKWDLVEDKDDSTYNKAVEYARQMLSPVKWAEVCFTSAKTGQRCTKLFDLVDEVAVQHRRRVKTSVLNEVLRDAVLWQAPPSKKSSGASQGKIYYCNQIATRPPTVAVFCNNPKLFGDNYKRYLDRKFREQLGLKSTPIRFLWRGKRLRRMEQDNRRNPKPYSDK